MPYDIIKNLSTSFSNGINAGDLHVAIHKSGMTSATLQSITTNADADTCVATFDVEPVASDKTIYDNVVSTYTFSSIVLDQSLHLVIDEHFMISNPNAAELGKYKWSKTLIGVNSGIDKKRVPGKPGVVELTVGQFLDGVAAVHIGSTTEGLSFQTGTFDNIVLETHFMLEGTLSSADFEYFLIGFADDNDTFGLPQNAGCVMFRPSQSPDIQMKTIITGTETSINTSETMTLGKWYRVVFSYSDLATNPTMSIEINGVVQGSIPFTMPLVPTSFSPTIKIDGKNGASLAKLNVDYFLMKEDYYYSI